MGLFDKFLNQIRPSDEDEGYLDDDYFDDPETEDEDYEYERKNRKKSFSLKSAEPKGIFQRKVIDGAPEATQVLTVRPSDFDDAKEITYALLDGTAVIINMEGVSTDVAQRIIDFTSGSIFAIDGDLKMIAKNIFIASPQNVTLTGALQGDFKGSAESMSPAGKPSAANGFSFNA